MTPRPAKRALEERRRLALHEAKRGSFHMRRIQPRFRGGGLDLLERKAGRAGTQAGGRAGGLRGFPQDQGDFVVIVEPRFTQLGNLAFNSSNQFRTTRNCVAAAGSDMTIRKRPSGPTSQFSSCWKS